MRIKVRSDFRSIAKNGLVHPGLRAEAEFYVLGASNEDYRVVDLAGEPILYPKELFKVLDSNVPSGWKFSEYDDGEYRLVPASTARPGFFEDWHGSDGDRNAQLAARRAFRDELRRLAAEARTEDRRLIEQALERLLPGTESAPAPE